MTLAFVFALFIGALAQPQQLAPQTVLSKYLDALGAVSEPKAMIFTYTLVQVGQPALYQTHRIYRSGVLTRDETIEVDGHTLSVPTVRVVNGRTAHYRIGEVAPVPASGYAFTFEKAVLTGHHWTYVYRTAPVSDRPFTVDTIWIDGLSFLPSRIDFTSSVGTVKAKGILYYAKTEQYWLIQEANVEAPIAGDRSAERILWSNYSFPASLPPETFRG